MPRVAVCFMLLVIASTLRSPSGAYSAPSQNPNLAFPKAVILYDSIPGTDEHRLVATLADTGADFVSRAYFTKVGRTVPSDLAQTIAYVKSLLPWIRLEGAVTAYSYCGPYDPSVVFTGSGSKAGSGVSCHRWALDIAKPKGAQLLIEKAEELIDVGFDALHFDCIDCLASLNGLNLGPYINAWKQIASQVKEYARTKFNKDLPVSLGLSVAPDGNILNLFPDQDYIALELYGGFTVDFSRAQAQIMQTYGRIPPVLLMLDYGSITPGHRLPLDTLATLPASDQIRIINVLGEAARNANVSFVYPMWAEGTKIYDARDQGTYDAIKRLTNQISTVASRRNGPTIMQTITQLCSAKVTLTSNEAQALLSNATSASMQMTQAFMNNDTQTLIRLSATVLQLIASAYNAELEYRTAESALMNATIAIQTAESQNRTSGLNAANQLLSMAYREFNAGNYTGAIQLANQARLAAETAVTPSPSETTTTSQGMTTNVPETALIALAVAIVAVSALVAMVLRRKRSSSP